MNAQRPESVTKWHDILVLALDKAPWPVRRGCPDRVLFEIAEMIADAVRTGVDERLDEKVFVKERAS